MPLLRVRRFDSAVDWLVGFVWTEARQQRWVCDSCKTPIRWLNTRQKAQWDAVQAPGRSCRQRARVECRRVLPPFRRPCPGHLVKAEAVTGP